MVCFRCKLLVRNELRKLGLNRVVVELGEVITSESMSENQLAHFKLAIEKSGLELMDHKKSILIEKIKSVIIELVHYSEKPLSTNLSVHISQKLQHDYSYLSNLFSEIQGITVEKYFITHKI